MSKALRTVFVVLFFLLISALSSAQAAAQPFTFPSGAGFTAPAGAEITDADGNIPTILFDDSVAIEMIEPGIIEATPGASADKSLNEVLTTLLALIGFEDAQDPEHLFDVELNDGRLGQAYDFVNANNNFQTLMVVRFGDERVGALNIRSINRLTQDQVAIILELATSFDLHAPVDPQAAIAEAERQLTEGFSGPHTYDSGVSFSYPPDFAIEAPAGQPAQIGISNVILMTLVDPGLVGIPAGEAMEDVIGFAVGGNNVDPDSFQPLDIGGREAVIGSGPRGALTQSLALVRFDDGSVGIIDILTPAALTGEQFLQIRGVAASFNSQSGEFTGTTREAFDQSRELFDQAMAARDSGDIGNAISLLDESLALDDSFALAHYWRGISHRDTGDLAAAQADFLAAAALEPNEPQIRIILSENYVLQNDLPSAIVELQTAADLQGSSATPALLDEIVLYEQIVAGEMVEGFYVNRAERFTDLGLYQAALADMQTLIDFEPDNWEWHGRQGNVYKAMDAYADAIASYTDGLEAEPVAILFYNRAIAYSDAAADDIQAIPDAIFEASNNYTCAILLADDTITPALVDAAELAKTKIILSGVEEITDPAQCVP